MPPAASSAAEAGTKKKRARGIKRKAAADREEDVFGENDLISRLPQDCLLRIFEHLSSADLCKVRQVSKRMYQVASHRSLLRGSAAFGCLSTSQIVNGYSFTLSTYDFGEAKRQKLKTIVYRNQVTESGEMKEEHKLKSGESLYATRLLRSLHNLPVSDRFCDVMGNLINRFAVPNVVFSRIRINAGFLINLTSSVMEMERIYIEHSTCDEDTSDDFLRFVKSARIVDLTIIGCPQIHENCLLTEQFLLQMENSRLRNLRIMESWETCMSNRFYPSKSLLPLLTAYDCLIMPSMTLEVEWIGELIMACLARPRTTTHRFWNIGVNRMPNKKEIKKQIMSNPDFTYRKKNGMYSVVKKSNAMKAHFDIVSIDVEGSFLHILDISFMSDFLDTLPYFREIGERRNHIETRCHLETINADYRPNLLTTLAWKQPPNFFSSISVLQLSSPNVPEPVPMPQNRAKKTRSPLWKAAMKKYTSHPYYNKN